MHREWKGLNAQRLLLDQNTCFVLVAFSSSPRGGLTNISTRCKQRSNSLTVTEDLNVIFCTDSINHPEVLVSSQSLVYFFLIFIYLYSCIPLFSVSVSIVSIFFSIIQHTQHEISILAPVSKMLRGAVGLTPLKAFLSNCRFRFVLRPSYSLLARLYGRTLPRDLGQEHTHSREQCSSWEDPTLAPHLPSL